MGAGYDLTNEILSMVFRTGSRRRRKKTHFISDYNRKEVVETHDRQYHEGKRHIEECHSLFTNIKFEGKYDVSTCNLIK